MATSILIVNISVILNKFTNVFFDVVIDKCTKQQSIAIIFHGDAYLLFSSWSKLRQNDAVFSKQPLRTTTVPSTLQSFSKTTVQTTRYYACTWYQVLVVGVSCESLPGTWYNESQITCDISIYNFSYGVRIPVFHWMIEINVMTERVAFAYNTNEYVYIHIVQNTIHVFDRLPVDESHS